jgi:hypothetical protein
MEKISWMDHVRNVLNRVKERNSLHIINRGKANWMGHIFGRNCLLNHVIEGKIEIINDGRMKT